MSVEAAPAQEQVSNEPVSHDDLAGLFKAELDAESAPAQAKPTQPAAPIEAAPDTESTLPDVDDAQAEQPETSDEDQSPAAIDAPRGMSEAEKALFAQLPPEAKAWLAKREKETQADYTRKTQEVAEQRKNIESGQARVMAQLQQYDQILSNFTARPLAPPDPALRQTDPLLFEDEMANYVHAKHQQEVAQAEQARVRAEYQGHAQEQQRQFWADQGKQLAQLAPELAANTPEAKKTRLAVFEYGTKAGYSKEQLNNASASDLVTLWKAKRYDDAMAQKATPVVQPAPKVMQPGPARAAGRSNGFASAVRTLSDNPTRASLAEAYRAELAAER